MSESIVALLSEDDELSPHIDYAINAARQRTASLTGIYIIEAWRFGEYSVPGWDIIAREDHQRKAETTLNAIQKRCGDEGIEFTPETTVGNPRDIVRTYVDDNDIDLVVCNRPVGDGKGLKSPGLHKRLEGELRSDIVVV